jgi:hypothetical protein
MLDRASALSGVPGGYNVGCGSAIKQTLLFLSESQSHEIISLVRPS